MLLYFVILPESNSEGFFKMTYLESYWELEEILADLAFLAEVLFFHQFLSKNIDSENFYRQRKYFPSELRCRTNFSSKLIYQRLLRPPTRLSNCPRCHTASTALWCLHLHDSSRIAACDNVGHKPLLREQREETSRLNSQNVWNFSWISLNKGIRKFSWT